MFKKISCLLLMFVSMSLSAFAFSAEKTTGEYIDDATLATRLITKLTISRQVQIADITTHTFRRQVQLCGFVKNQRQANAAVRIAQSVNGVEKVYNFLIPKTMLKPRADTVGRYVDDTLTTTNVKRQLYNNKRVSANDISVETYKGTVELCGFVDTPQQISAAMMTVKGVDGVQDVINHLVAKNKL